MRLGQPVLASWMALVLGAVVGVGASAPAAVAHAQDAPQNSAYSEELPRELRTWVWLDRAEEEVLSRGERLRIYYRVEEDAFVSIFHIDTDGVVRLLHPGSPVQNNYARGGRDYRVLFPDSPYWFVDDEPGLGFFFVVASLEPFDLNDISFHPGAGWDLAFVGRQVYRDPYEAMDDYVEAILPEWADAVFGMDFVSYSVGDRHDFPRFMCYDCHGFRAFDDWNPYRTVCTEFRVVIWDDPYFYPATRYGASGVVVPRSSRLGPRFEFKEALAVGGAGQPVVRRRGVPRNPGDELDAPGFSGGQVMAPSRRARDGQLEGEPPAGFNTETGESRRTGAVVNPGSSSGVRSGFRRPPLRPPNVNTSRQRPDSRNVQPRTSRPGSGVSRPSSPARRGGVVTSPRTNRSGTVRPRPSNQGGARVAPPPRRGTVSPPSSRQRPPPRVRTAKPKRKKPGGGL